MEDDGLTLRPPSHRRGRHRPPIESRLTLLAVLIVVIPWLVALIHVVLTAPSSIALPDDLALIELHTRRAMHLSQQLGVFDHYGWSHPGPTYFYLQALPGWLLGSSARALFVGAALIGALSSLAIVWVVERRAGALRALVASGGLAWLGFLLTAHGPAALTYSEGRLGALVSPWNPMVVIIPLLLVLVLVAAAWDGSGCSALAAVLVGSFVVQTDISTTPVVGLVVACGIVGWVLARRGHPLEASARRRWLGAATAVGIVVVWIPPLIEEATGHPGNMTLLWRFFTTPHASLSFTESLHTAVAGLAVATVGPGEIMSSILGGPPHHGLLAVVTAIGSLAAGVCSLVLGLRARRRFAAGLGAASVVGLCGLVLGASHIVGFAFGYLVIWACVLPVAAALSVLLLEAPAGLRSTQARRVGRFVVVGLASLAGVMMLVGVLTLPPVSATADPQVAALTRVVVGSVPAGSVVEIEDAGAGSSATQLLDVERFFGLINQLDKAGYQPKVNSFWQSQLGPSYVAGTGVRHVVTLSTWTAASESHAGYVGRVGDMAVMITPR